MDAWNSYLEGGDLRSIADVAQLIPLIQNQSDFDALFKYLYSSDRLLVMRASDAIEKITVRKPELLTNYKTNIIQLLYTASDKELKWHLALMVSRLKLSEKELIEVWDALTNWAKDKGESKIVRVNSIQALFDLTKQCAEREMEFEIISNQIISENIPSINARLKKLNKK